jgi:streptomycin 6-kinase
MQTLKKNMINIYGDKAKIWLANLPKRILQIEANYGLSNLQTVKNLSYNYVLSGFQGSQAIILKLGLDLDGFKREANALKAFAGFGVVKVLAENEGMLLLERAIPGDALKSYFPKQDGAAIRICTQCLIQLHKAPLPEPNIFPNIKDWLALLDKNWDIPESYLKKARQLRDNLLQTSNKAVLLHGDLHHNNILQSQDGYLVIDPKGVIGEPAYEVAAFIRNPLSLFEKIQQPYDVKTLIQNRVIHFSELLNLPSQRILDWCFVQAVLAWAWALEDQGDVTYFKNLTALFENDIHV